MDSEIDNTHSFRMELAFDGTSYSGWQIQLNAPSVQQVLQEQLCKLLDNADVKLHGSGRTDAGVHATNMSASFKVPVKQSAIPPDKMTTALNGMLPSSIKIKNITPCSKDFHARFSALGKAYTYVINRAEKSPFTSAYSYHQNTFQNIKAVEQAAKELTGTHDFTAYSAKRAKGKETDNTRTVFNIEIEHFGQFTCLTFTGDGFLYKMVRALAGALIKVGSNRMTTCDVKRVLDSKQRSEAPPIAPPHGLFLVKVFYDQDESCNNWQHFKIDSLPFFQA